MSPKIITSRLTNQQLQQLAHQVLNQSDQSIIDNWMNRMSMKSCAPDYFRQNIIDHIATRAGRDPDSIVQWMIERAEAAKKKAEVTHAPPTSAPPEPPKRRVAVFVNCHVCKRDVAVPEEQADGVNFCSEACQRKNHQMHQSAANELQKFCETMPDLYECDFNTDLFIGWFRANGRPITAENLYVCYRAVKDRLLKSLTAKDVERMTSQQYAERLKIDPGMGGLNTQAYRKFQSKNGGVN